ncbi:MBL fold metallo-hydrolase [Patescibacteria group bacterium]|nr:MBL fold metallo-hydrolase [Patescibacteria group bacterium]
MHLTWYGQACFKLRSKEGSVVMDPFDESCGLRPLKTKADILTLSQTGKESKLAPESIKNETFVIDSPGEYEVAGVFIEGIASSQDKKEGPERGRNTIYTYNLEGMTVCHLGYLGEVLNEKQIEKVDGVDILLLPIGGGETLGVEEAIKVMNAIEPRVVIPMHYHLKGLTGDKKETIETFCQELGVKKGTFQDKAIIKKKELPTEGIKTFVLSPPS